MKHYGGQISPSMKGLNFLVIAGFQRCGTSYLADLLSRHEKVLRTKETRPEPRIFWDAKKDYGPALVKQFGRLEDSPESTYLLEKSTSYSDRPLVGERILELFPEAKCIFLIRDPIERAVSHFNFSTANGIEKMDARTAFLFDHFRVPRRKPRGISADPFKYLSGSLYADRLEKWMTFWPTQNFILIQSEALFSNPSELNRLLGLLGLNNISNDALLNPNNSSRNDSADGLSAEDKKYLRNKYEKFFNEDKSRLEKIMSCLKDGKG